VKPDDSLLRKLGITPAINIPTAAPDILLPNGRHHKSWIQGFLDYASYGESPMHFYYWVAVSTIAGALRRHVWVQQILFQWFPNFYIVLVAPPGIAAKSTTTSIGMSLLREVPGVKFGPDAVTWPALSKSLSESTELVDMGNGDFLPMSAVTIESSEFGVFLNTNDRQMLDVLVTLWDGKQLHKATKSQGEELVQNPFINMIACTTPTWIEGNFPEYMIGGGFTSRCVFVYADKKRQLVPYLEDVIPPGHEDRRRKLIADLERIALLRGQYTLTREAKQLGTELYERLNSKRPAEMDNERFGGYWVRKQTSLHKLAMVLSAAEGDSMLIQPNHLEEADTMLTALEVEMAMVFDKIGRTESSRGQYEVLAALRAYPTTTILDLYKAVFRVLSFNDYRVALDSVIQAGYAKVNGSAIHYVPRD